MDIRIKCSSAIALLLLLLHSATAQEENPKRWVRSDDVLIRVEPGNDRKVIGKLQKGTVVEFQSPSLNHYCLISSQGILGFVACQYLSDEVVNRRRAGEDGEDVASRWVISGAVNFRETASSDANIVSVLPLNTVVKLLDEAAMDGSCKIRISDGTTGFVGCPFLGTTPYFMGDDPKRDFWIQPSGSGFFRYAKFLKEQHPDIGWEGPWPRDEEFERMKAHLAKGFKTPLPAADSFLDWERIKTEAATEKSAYDEKQSQARDLTNLLGIYGEQFDQVSGESMPRAITLVRRLEFESIKPSFFQNELEIASARSTTAELSGRFQIVFRTLVVPREPKKYESDYSEAAGLYDVRGLTDVLTRSVQQVRLLSDGTLQMEPSVARQTQVLWDTEQEEPECSGWNEGFSLGDADSKAKRIFKEADFGEMSDLNQSRSKNRSVISLFRFYTNLKLPDHAAVLHTKSQVDFESMGFSQGTATYFDINDDGVQDIVIWEGAGPYKAVVYGSDISEISQYRLALVNIAGHWKVLGSDNFAFECGC